MPIKDQVVEDEDYPDFAVPPPFAMARGDAVRTRQSAAAV